MSILRKLPPRYASVVMPLILSVLMTFVVSVISTLKSLGPTPAFLATWPGRLGLVLACRVSNPAGGAAAGAADRIAGGSRTTR